MNRIANYSMTAVIFLAMLMTFAAIAATPSKVKFYFYGAEDCPPCMAFKRDGLPIVQQSAAEAGYEVSDNVIRRTANIGEVGIFGEADPILRRAALQMNRLYPPVFFVTRGDQIVSLHGHDWRAAMRQAELTAFAATN